MYNRLRKKRKPAYTYNRLRKMREDRVHLQQAQENERSLCTCTKASGKKIGARVHVQQAQENERGSRTPTKASGKKIEGRVHVQHLPAEKSNPAYMYNALEKNTAAENTYDLAQEKILKPFEGVFNNPQKVFLV